MTNQVFDKFVINGVSVAQNPTSIVMTQDTTVVAQYKVEQMGTVIFNGTVSAQAGAGRAVVITITKPVGTATVDATTLADKTFTATYTDVAGSYSARAVASEQQDANNIWLAGTSPAVPFTLAKTPIPTIVTLTVT